MVKQPIKRLVPYLTLSCADVIEGHRALAGPHGNPVAAVAVAHHVESAHRGKIHKTHLEPVFEQSCEKDNE